MKISVLLRELLAPWESVRRIKRTAATATQVAEEVHLARFLTGQIAAHGLRKDIQSIQEAEFQVFSQFGEDGIIQFLVQRLGSRIDKSFVEFGVQMYLESNTLFLLMNNGWRGLILDGEAQYIREIAKREFNWKYGLRARCAFVSRENINQIFQEEGFDPELGLLSIDVDGIDWHLWNALTIQPGILVIEYNRNFPLDRPVTIPYEPFFDRTEKHKSNMYYGTSLGALAVLAAEKGYTFVGVERHRRNAFFIRNDLAAHVPTDTIREEYVDREAHKTMELLRGLPVYNVVTKAIEKI
jgi:hypothetical protein